MRKLITVLTMVFAVAILFQSCASMPTKEKTELEMDYRDLLTKEKAYKRVWRDYKLFIINDRIANPINLMSFDELLSHMVSYNEECRKRDETTLKAFEDYARAYLELKINYDLLPNMEASIDKSMSTALEVKKNSYSGSFLRDDKNKIWQKLIKEYSNE